MKNETASTNAIHTLNVVMMWLMTVTIMLIAVPWKEISPAFARIVDQNSMFLYFALCVEISNFVSQAVVNTVTSWTSAKESRRISNRMEHLVAGLDFAERALLREYVLQRRSVLQLPVNEPTVQGLLECGILSAAGAEDEATGKAPLIISYSARPFITYKAIGLSRGKMSEQSLEQIMSARPEFARTRETRRSYRGAGMRAAAA